MRWGQLEEGADKWVFPAHGQPAWVWSCSFDPAVPMNWMWKEVRDACREKGKEGVGRWHEVFIER